MANNNAPNTAGQRIGQKYNSGVAKGKEYAGKALNKVKANPIITFGVFVVIWFFLGWFIQLWGCDNNKKDDKGKCPPVDWMQILWTIVAAILAAGVMGVYNWLGSKVKNA